MVTKIRQKARLWPYLKEHREAAGLSALQMAGRLDPPVERESVYRYERNPLKMSLERLQQWAEACGLESYRDLFRPPGRPSVDARIDDLPTEAQPEALDLAIRAVNLARRAG